MWEPLAATEAKATRWAITAARGLWECGQGPTGSAMALNPAWASLI